MTPYHDSEISISQSLVDDYESQISLPPPPGSIILEKDNAAKDYFHDYFSLNTGVQSDNWAVCAYHPDFRDEHLTTSSPNSLENTFVLLVQHQRLIAIV